MGISKKGAFFVATAIGICVLGIYFGFRSRQKTLSPEEFLRIRSRLLILQNISHGNEERLEQIGNLELKIIVLKDDLSPETAMLGNQALASLKDLKNALRKIDVFVKSFPDATAKTLQKRATEIDAISDEVVQLDNKARIICIKFLITQKKERNDFKSRPVS